MKSTDQIKRISRRFEIALSNFGRSCMDMQANEKVFQAWYAACIIQEFGLSHVYREIHLWKSELFELSRPNDMTKSLAKGNELFPDVSVSWFPDIDARHSSTRENNLRPAGALLSEFAIISELKVTGSTLHPTPPKAIFIDISKLFVFSEAHKNFSSNNESTSPLKCYMVVFDNAKNLIGEFKKSYTKAKIDQIAERALNYWTDGVPKPDIALISPGENSARLSLLKNFTKWVDF
jgi:hypothetical protein